MQITQCKYDLGTNELDCGLLEATHTVDVVVDVAAWQVLKEEVDFQLVLKDEIHGVNEWMLRLEQNVLLVFDILHLFLLEEQVLVDALHRVHLAHLAVRNEKNLAKAALINDLCYLKIFKTDNLAFQAWFANQAL